MTLTYQIDDEITGCATGCDELDEVSIEATLVVDGDEIGTVDWSYQPEVPDEITIHSMAEFEVSPSDLDGTDEERIQFAADMTAEVIKSITAQRDMHRERLAREREAIGKEREEFIAGQALLRNADMRLAKVYDVVNKCLLELEVPAATDGWSGRDAYMQASNMAGQKVREALRFLGLGPQALEVVPEKVVLDTEG